MWYVYCSSNFFETARAKTTGLLSSSGISKDFSSIESTTRIVIVTSHFIFLQEEFEDSTGNVVNKRIYDDLKRQGLL